jgi:CheY-like chemotaxis protein
LEDALQEALAHLYDPEFEAADSLVRFLGCSSDGGVLAVQSRLLQAIEGLRPADDGVSQGRARTVYEVLRCRYVLGMTQEETAERLRISVTSVWRAQREAAHAVAVHLWGQMQSETAPGSGQHQAQDWQAQARHELASLRDYSQVISSDLGEVLQGVLKLEESLTERRGVEVEVAFVQAGIEAALHPTVLRQVLITALARVLAYTVSDTVRIYAGLEDADVRITITAAVDMDHGVVDADLLRGILLPDEVSADATIEGGQAFVYLGVPAVGRSTVLAVDDNRDMIRFYRRSMEGTRYQIVDVQRGEDVRVAIDAYDPDVILLDVMLPDVDGWELLSRLYEDPATRHIPVIVCSVVHEEDLAHALGAALYLSKPIRRRELVDAVDRVLSTDVLQSEQR